MLCVEEKLMNTFPQPHYPPPLSPSLIVFFCAKATLRRIPSKRPSIDEMLEHTWLANRREMTNKREAAVFNADRMISFKDEWRFRLTFRGFSFLFFTFFFFAFGLFFVCFGLFWFVFGLFLVGVWFVFFVLSLFLVLYLILFLLPPS